MNTVSTGGQGAASVQKSNNNLEELVSSSDTERNWPGVLIALFVICIVLSLILVSTVVLTPGDWEPRVTKPRVPQNAQSRWTNNASWIFDDIIVFKNKQGGISRYNPATNTVAEIVNSLPFRQLNAQSFLMSNDLKFVALVSNVRQVYKYTKEASYHMYELASKVRFPVTHKYVEVQSTAPLLQTLKFGPVGSAFAFVVKNQLYYCSSGKERQGVKLSSGEEEWLYHGYPDWLYQNEIFQSDEAFWFSTNGSYIAYAVFNDSSVGKVSFTRYGDMEPYPKSEEIPYPKPGTSNANVSLWVVSLQDGFNKSLIPKPKQLSKDNSYLAGVQWTSDSEVVTVWINRRQNLTVYSICAVQTNFSTICSVEAAISAEGKPAELRPRLFEPLTREQSEMFTTLPTLFSKLFKNTNGWIYYEDSPENKPTQRHLYRVEDNINLTQIEQCVTCPTTYGNNSLSDIAAIDNSSIIYNGALSSYPFKTTDCLYTKTTFSRNRRYYMIECLGPDVPSVHVFESVNDTKIATLDANSALRNKFYNMALPQLKLFPVELENGALAQVKLQLPPGLREYEDMVFPLVLKVSGKPGEPAVTHSWAVDYSSYLASKMNYVVAEIDIGNEVSGKTTLRLLSVVEYLKDNLKFIDKTRIAVYGEGYGGYMAAMILTLDTEMFNCGVSINGIFSWPHYNSVWTERWLHTANITDNYRGYEDADVTKKVGNLKDKKFYLFDSTADDEVHYQHAMLMVRALVQANVIFKHMSYPDEGHDLKNVRNHLYRSMDLFWTECFGELDFEEWETGINGFPFKS